MITPLDIENKKFSKQMMNGYSVEEVDEFLDDLTADHGVAVRNQVVHHAAKAFEVGGMQSDGRLVEHIEHPACPVAHGPGQLHPLPLAGGEGGGGAVKGQIAYAKVEQAPGGVEERGADAFGHGSHLFRKRGRHAFDPFHNLGKRHRAGLGKGYSPEPWRPGRVGKPCASAVRADIEPQELLDPLHSLFVLDLRQRVLDSVCGVEEGEIQLGRVIGVLGLVENVLFLGRTV